MLYIVATPIGNLKDITLRALEILRSVDLILCEDTRVTRKLLEHYQINTPTLSYHHHTPERKVKEIIQLLLEGKNLALVTDAGTPGISDPGNRLVQKLIGMTSAKMSGANGDTLAGVTPIDTLAGVTPIDTLAGVTPIDTLAGVTPIKIVPIPGPCAAIATLSISGLPTDKFLFLGFPPHKNRRQKFLKEAASQSVTTILYESPHRIVKTLTELTQFLTSDRPIMVARELTKQFETIYRGSILEVLEQIKKDPIKGEFVVVITPKK